MRGNMKQKGFTIVELLIVIVVIGILAGITVVAFNGIQDRARQTQVTSAANQAGKKAQLYATEYGTPPPSLADIGISNGGGINYNLTQSGSWYCVTAQSATNSNFIAGGGSNGSCAQLDAKYYNNNSLSGSPALERIDPNINFTWSTGSPASGVNADNFSAVWTGYITAPTSGTYTLHYWFDDRIRVYFNNTLAIDEWATGCCTWRSSTYNFTGGQPTPFKLEMSESGGGAGVRLMWSYEGQTQTIIPPSAFSS